MKVVLIYPPREHYIFGMTPHLHVEADAGSYPSIGMLYIAAYLEKYSDAEVKVLDAHTEQMSHEQVKEYLRRENPDIAGIYFSTYYLKDGIMAARSAREARKDTFIVAGGPHTVYYPRETIRIPEIDCVMAGESEESFCELVERVEKRDLAGIDALPNALTKNSPETKIPVRGRIGDIDSLPFPARHLTDVRKYRSILTKENPITTVITSRGCPFSCNFCANIESGQKVRYRSPGNVVDELQQVVERFGIRDFLFFDELFTSNRQRAADICDEILRRDLKIRWHCRSRVDVLDEALVKKMKTAGLRLIQFGIETGNAGQQKLINKHLDLSRVRETVRMVHDNEIYTYADFMFGLPGETEEETRNTLAYAKTLMLDYIAFGVFHPIPGSTFYGRFLQEGHAKDFWKDYVSDPESTVYDYTYTGRDRDKYERVVSSAYNSYYLRPGYIVRKIVRADSFSQAWWQAKSAVKVFSKFI
ncbi:MAG: B12-binding domain-containing radical SAM protein [Endomicrobiales bacterium]